MEEAYSELYQNFLRLKALCLRQAVLLRQLTETLQKQKSPDGGRWNFTALKYNGFDVLYIWNPLSADPSVEIPEHLQEKPGPSPCNLTAAGGLPKNMETFSDLLAMDMSKLAVHGGCQPNGNQEWVQNVPPLQNLEPSRWPGGSGASRPSLPARVGIIPDPKLHLICKYYHCPHGPVLSVQPQALATNMADVFTSQADGILMSDVALQSHVCDFCQAVFPGDTSTRGDFLRHLYTHIT